MEIVTSPPEVKLAVWPHECDVAGCSNIGPRKSMWDKASLQIRACFPCASQLEGKFGWINVTTFGDGA